MSPCRIPALIDKYGVSLSGVKMVDEVSVYRTLMAEMILSGILYSLRISNILPLSTESKTFEKSTKTSARSRLDNLDSSIESA